LFGSLKKQKRPDRLEKPDKLRMGCLGSSKIGSPMEWLSHFHRASHISPHTLNYGAGGINCLGLLGRIRKHSLTFEDLNPDPFSSIYGRFIVECLTYTLMAIIIAI
jgi:hypothetical protein